MNCCTNRAVFARAASQATDELLPLVYEELRLLAAQKLSREPAGRTLAAAGLSAAIPRGHRPDAGEPARGASKVRGLREFGC